MDLNKVIIATTLGADAELKTMNNGNSVLNFRGATNRKYTKDGETQEETSWLRYVLYGQRAEKVAQYLTKGTTLVVEGRLSQRSYTDKDGNKRESIEIVVDSFNFVPRGNGGNGNTSGNASRNTRPSQPQAAAFDEDFDEVPF